MLPAKIPWDFPVTGQVQGRKGGIPPRDRTEAMIPVPRGLCQSKVIARYGIQNSKVNSEKLSVKILKPEPTVNWDLLPLRV